MTVILESNHFLKYVFLLNRFRTLMSPKQCSLGTFKHDNNLQYKIYEVFVV